MTYDEADGYVLLFGGLSVNAGVQHGDTWTFQSGVWTNRHTATAPAPRYGAAMAYDAADGYVVLFGGINSVPAWLGDTWTYSAGVWTLVPGGAGPAGRAYAAMTYDWADGYLLMFGGYNGSSTTFYNDTWEFSAGAWNVPTGLSSMAPSTRSGSEMAYDSEDGDVVLFSGQQSTGAIYGDTWYYLNGTWSNITAFVAGAPGGLAYAGMVDDTYDGYLVLFGGLDQFGFAYGNTWSYLAGTWATVNPVHVPGVDYAQVMAFDPVTNQVVLESGVFVSGTWTY
jgi:hypothetical protein